jgi:predicted Co/Zn/Cd cation transporter (cation efflux family)
MSLSTVGVVVLAVVWAVIGLAILWALVREVQAVVKGRRADQGIRAMLLVWGVFFCAVAVAAAWSVMIGGER